MASSTDGRNNAAGYSLGKLGAYLAGWIPAPLSTERNVHFLALRNLLPPSISPYLVANDLFYLIHTKTGSLWTYPRPPHGAQEETAALKLLLPPEQPDFYMGSLEEAIQQCRELKKFLVVYLHSEMHQDSANFVEKVLCTEAITAVLNRNFVVWAGDISMAGAYMVSLKLHVDGFPALCVFCPSNFVPRTHMAVLNEARIHLPYDLYKFVDTCNNTDADDVLQMLAGVVEQYGGWISAVERQVREAQANRQLMEDQDAAYNEAVRADEELARRAELEEQERIERESIEAEELRLAEVRAAEQALEERRRLEEELRLQEIAAAELERARQSAAQRLQDEPAADAPDAVSVTFRATDASRISRRFRKTDTVQHLYDFCRTLPNTPPDFSLAIPFPRRALSDKSQSLDDLNINKAILNIEAL